ncbi:MAG TPA: haloacid dehalogenase type II [Candidatus Aquilonibacter sp.]|nr:haloacid dehalogenase type II [Candidatus Aquilonibacter sp.]
MNSSHSRLDFNRFEVISFDCYGTLINWEEGILNCLRPILANHDKSADDATILKLFADYEADAEQGAYRRYSEVLERVVRGFGDYFKFTPTNDETACLAKSLADWKPWPDTVGALRQLQRRFRLCIISNVDDDLFASTQPRLGITFDHVVTAQQAKAYKPSLKIFELAFSRIGVPTHRILHVGQSIFHDVIPAQSLGLATVWVNRPSAREGVGAVKASQGYPDVEVAGFAELVAATGLG